MTEREALLRAAQLADSVARDVQHHRADELADELWRLVRETEGERDNGISESNEKAV